MTVGRIFLVEAYAPSTSEFGRLSDQARRAAAERAVGPPITHLRSIHVPEDEICFHLFEADSADELATAIAGADIRAQRIVEVRA
jgi:hypothetical protein